VKTEMWTRCRNTSSQRGWRAWTASPTKGRMLTVTVADVIRALNCQRWLV